MSNSTNSTDESIAGSFIAAFGPIIIIGCFGFCFYQWYQGYKKRKKRRFDYKPVQARVVNAVPVQAPRVVNAVPVQPAMQVVKGRIIPQTDTRDLDERIRDFFKQYEIIYFPCRKIDLDRLKIIAGKLRFDRVFFATIRGAGRGLYVIVGNRTYKIDLMFTENLMLERNLLETASSIPTTQKLYPIYKVDYVLRVYDLWLKVRQD